MWKAVARQHVAQLADAFGIAVKIRKRHSSPQMHRVTEKTEGIVIDWASNWTHTWTPNTIKACGFVSVLEPALSKSKGAASLVKVLAQLKIPRHSFQDAFMRLCRSASSVHYDHPLRLPFRNLQITLTHPPKKSPRLLLEAVLVAVATACGSRGALIAPAGATHNAGGIGIQQDR